MHFIALKYGAKVGLLFISNKNTCKIITVNSITMTG